MTQVRDLNIISRQVLSSPAAIRDELPISSKIEDQVDGYRRSISAILRGDDSRFLLIIGPCSIHDPKAAIEYAQKLKNLADKLADSMLIVMRVYFEKPRTSVGWKGLINDPELDDSFNIEKGLRVARKLMIDICEIGLPIGTEALDPITPQYLDDVTSWTAIGARTVESQTHREMASGLSTPVGFKNGTDGNVDVMINALMSVSSPHAFLGVNREGQCAVFKTSGNKSAHGILRGGGGKSNFDQDSIANCISKLEKAGLHSKLVIDCSHGNSNKDYRQQAIVLNDIVSQRLAGNTSICGAMLESNLNEGKQDIADLKSLKYGVSITDACIGWSETESLLTNVGKNLLA
jgi:3-deoxy-7-phosphoheptulonate synthase